MGLVIHYPFNNATIIIELRVGFLLNGHEGTTYKNGPSADGSFDFKRNYHLIETSHIETNQ